MRRVLWASLSLLLLVVGAAPGPVTADTGHRRPKITVMRFADAPLTADPGKCEGPGTCHEEHLIIKAHDPDSSITEIEVWFDEKGDGRAPLVFGHTYCVQGKADGTVARFKIPVTFTEPGDYTVAATAYSHKRCKPHEKSDGHASLHSRTKRLEVTVEAPS